MNVAEPDTPVPPPARCSLCGHPWSAHFGGGPTAVWVTCCALPGQAEPATASGTASPGTASVSGAELAADRTGGSETDGPNRDPERELTRRAAAGTALPAVAGLAGPAPSCYCRRSVEEFRQEALREARATAGHPHPPAASAGGTSGDDGADDPRPGAAPGVVLCVTCRAAPAQDTQCHPCRQARQHASRARFAARHAQLTRDTRHRRTGRG
ncbi:hypothetical protein [Pseudofrankia sp. BMG5.37]|uniref:hypothetical protein n=1 Tax=Pseudofrankia sp. BMG5.37 TaxID=3050035 RepID=UPI0028941B5A|nr:hypothetical protein [Pseudofrankia sp. BMG5.37]MDT3441677.1 hypothetical protein [Pseudofrankia sp. BMG5.37]